MWAAINLPDKELLEICDYAECEELPILNMKTPNETRFVNSILSGIKTFLCNSPAITRVLGLPVFIKNFS